MIYCDQHPSILQWSSEEISVPYISPTDKKSHRYFPDFIIKKIDKNGKTKIMMIEIKPFSQVSKPKSSSRNPKVLKENIRWQINNAKWRAADKFCKKHGWEFKILTEKELNI